MKKTILIAALFAVAGVAGAQNAAPTPGASAPAVQPAAPTAKTVVHKKAHAKKHVKHAANKGDKANAAGTETVAKADASTTPKAAPAPTK